MDFLDLLPTLISCNFFSTEPILKNSDVFSRWESNSFISAVLVAQSMIEVPSLAYLWGGISKISKIRMCTTPSFWVQVLSPNGPAADCSKRFGWGLVIRELHCANFFDTSKTIEYHLKQCFRWYNTVSTHFRLTLEPSLFWGCLWRWPTQNQSSE